MVPLLIMTIILYHFVDRFGVVLFFVSFHFFSLRYIYAEYITLAETLDSV